MYVYVVWQNFIVQNSGNQNRLICVVLCAKTCVCVAVFSTDINLGGLHQIQNWKHLLVHVTYVLNFHIFLLFLPGTRQRSFSSCVFITDKDMDTWMTYSLLTKYSWIVPKKKCLYSWYCKKSILEHWLKSHWSKFESKLYIKLLASNLVTYVKLFFHVVSCIWTYVTYHRHFSSNSDKLCQQLNWTQTFLPLLIHACCRTWRRMRTYNTTDPTEAAVPAGISPNTLACTHTHKILAWLFCCTPGEYTVII